MSYVEALEPDAETVGVMKARRGRDIVIEPWMRSDPDARYAELLRPDCGPCANCANCANCGPGSPTDAGQVTVSAINHNVFGRSGPGAVWLASPPTVAASAILGWLGSFEDLRRTVQAS